MIEAHNYGPPKALEQPDALLLTNSIMDIYQAYPELRGHLISRHLQRNPATNSLPSLGLRGTHLAWKPRGKSCTALAIGCVISCLHSFLNAPVHQAYKGQVLY